MVESQDFVSPERFQFDTDGTSDFTRTLDRSQDSLGRYTGWDLKDGSTTENSVAYDYSVTDGHLSGVSNPQSSNQQFTYSYLML